jgi:erythronate-4-phosphate dehydrogenase
MKIVCATSLTAGEEVFRTVGEVLLVPETEITREVLADADALVIRSKTRVTPELLDGTPVRFVGTATAGTDHMDLAYLSACGVAWMAAAGCNANSVSEYVLAAVLHMVRRRGLLLSDLCLGIVGVGHVGKKVEAKARALGLPVRLNDPPRELQDGDPNLLPLSTVIAEADILSFHVPLNEDGPFQTRRLVDHRFFEHLKPGCLFINASRGEVVVADALMKAMDQGVVRGAALDVWENEPRVRPEVLEYADLGSPHVAGHSFEGKIDGTLMVYEDLCRFFEVPSDPSVYRHREPSGGIAWTEIDGRGQLDQDILWQAVRAAHDVEIDDAALRATMELPVDEQKAAFNRLRREYRMRREFPCTGLRVRHVSDSLQQQLATLGFRVSGE